MHDWGSVVPRIPGPLLDVKHITCYRVSLFSGLPNLVQCVKSLGVNDVFHVSSRVEVGRSEIR
jgi:hypothetical protein